MFVTRLNSLYLHPLFLVQCLQHVDVSIYTFSCKLILLLIWNIAVSHYVQNSAARIVCKASKFNNCESLLYSLHWLPVKSRIQYKVSSVCYDALERTGPRYLSCLLDLYVPISHIRSSSDTRILKIPLVNNKYGERSFSFTAPSIWNSLPRDLRFSKSRPSFRSALKTHLFRALT